MDNIQAYNIVKDMLCNNSLPINKGSGDEAIITRKLIIDKKVMLNLLIDLQRFRKLLFLHKKFFIFQVTYDGKQGEPPEGKIWREKVETRVT